MIKVWGARGTGDERSCCVDHFLQRRAEADPRRGSGLCRAPGGAHRSERFPKETFDKLGEMALLGIMIPAEYGGAGADVISCCIVLSELARVCASTALSYGAHTVLCTNNLYLHGNDAQRRRYLPDLISGKRLGAWAVTEPGAGSDALGLVCRAERRGDEYVLNGSKIFITNAPVADVFIVFARTRPGSAKQGVSAFIIERGYPGFTVGPKLEKMGMRGSPTSEIFLDDCRCPAANLLGEEHGGAAQMMAGFDIERVTLKRDVTDAVGRDIA